MEPGPKEKDAPGNIPAIGTPPGTGTSRCRALPPFTRTSMNKSVGVILLLFLAATAAPSLQGQDRADSSAAPRPVTGVSSRQLLDEDGDGVADRPASPEKKRLRGKDRFIDRDADGICDERASGLGFRRGASGTGKNTDDYGIRRNRHQGGKK